MIAHELEMNIQFAYRDARKRGLELVTVEHLLLALLDSREVVELLDILKADHLSLRRDLEDFLNHRVPRSTGPRTESRVTPGFQRVLRRAITEAKNSNFKVTPVSVIASIYEEPESFGAQYLERHGVQRKNLVDWLRKRRALATHEAPAGAQVQPHEDEGEEGVNLARNLSVAVLRGEIERPLVRSDIETSVLRILCRRYKNNPLLVGEPGVGKTAIVHALAHKASEDTLPPALANLEIHEIQVSSLVAGTRYRGDFEARVKKLVNELSKRPNVLLFIDEIHSLIGAGSVSGGNLDAANILKPALVDGSIRCIGATTPTEYARVFAKDHTLARRFQKITVSEPSYDETLAILHELSPRLAKYHKLTYHDSALDAAIRLSQRFFADRHLPDKAVDLLDEAGASNAMIGSTATVNDKTLAKTVAQLTGVAVTAIGKNDRSLLRQLDKKLSNEVFGQPQAIKQLVAAVRRSRLGLSRQDRPIGSFLFTGPTGVGKTALANALSKALNLKLIRLDMSEYMERHSVSRLIGAPPGYVGFEQAGQLTEKVGLNPHCVLLIDEVEKSHPDVFNILLQIMDYGTLTDSVGQPVDFSHTTIILTSNIGAKNWEKQSFGFTEPPSGDNATNREINRLFSAEFRNRLDAQIQFKPLPVATAKLVVAKELASLAQRLAEEQRLQVTFGKAIHSLLLEQGFSESQGARSLQRAINSFVIDALATEQLRKALPEGSRITIDYNSKGQVKIKKSG